MTRNLTSLKKSIFWSVLRRWTLRVILPSNGLQLMAGLIYQKMTIRRGILYFATVALPLQRCDRGIVRMMCRRCAGCAMLDQRHLGSLFPLEWAESFHRKTPAGIGRLYTNDSNTPRIVSTGTSAKSRPEQAWAIIYVTHNMKTDHIEARDRAETTESIQSAAIEILLMSALGRAWWDLPEEQQARFRSLSKRCEKWIESGYIVTGESRS